MKDQVAEIRQNNAEVDATLQIIENPTMPRGVKEKMKDHLNEIHSDFNWKLYLDLIEEDKPTIH